MRRLVHRSGWMLLLIGMVTAIAGCGNQELYSNLPEKEANEMMAILIDSGITCSKVPGDDGAWDLTVQPEKFADAVSILSDLGRPRQTFATIEELFPKTGLVSSPAEQRIRLTYGLEQALAKTVSDLPKVVMARVHLVLPDNNPFSESAQPSSASVVVTHRVDADTESMIPQIKQIVLGGVADLEVDAVFVELVEADESLFGGGVRPQRSPSEPQFAEILTIQVAQGSVPKFLSAIVVSAATFLIGLGLIVASLLRRRRQVKQTA